MGRGGAATAAASMTGWFRYLWDKATGKERGDIWMSTSSSSSDLLKSDPTCTGRPLRVAFRNATPVPLVLCWVSEAGQPHHFYPLPPATCVYDAPAGSCREDHVERTRTGHAFVVAVAPGDDNNNNDILSNDNENETKEDEEKQKTLDPALVIGGYRPRMLNPKHDNDSFAVHLVTITRTPKSIWNCCQPSLRGSNDKDEWHWHLRVQSDATLDKTPVDTTKKVYEHGVLGGWPVRMERNWHGGDDTVQERLCNDFQAACECLPPHALEFLRSNCPVWINASIKYGPAVCPTKGRGMCFHPGVDWLLECGMNPQKVKCVELYNASEYPKDACLWGPGGILIHEFSHAYHHEMIKDGYDNEEIKKCWELAMKEGLYDCVEVHGRQGPKAKAYACTDPMEYFAELSTAFLGGCGEEYADKEFNKWYPFNRKQLKQHDPRAYKLLKRLWKVEIEDDEEDEQEIV